MIVEDQTLMSNRPTRIQSVRTMIWLPIFRNIYNWV